MNRILILVTLVSASLLSPYAWGHEPGEKIVPEQKTFRTRLPPTLPGKSYEEMQAVLDRHRQALMQVPGVHAAYVGRAGIVVGLTVHSQTREIAPDVRARATADIPKTLEGIPVKVEVGTLLPPPPGVIILRPGGVREQAESCPPRFREIESSTWRFCVDGNSPAIPAIMTPPIANIPYEEAMAIHDRHQMELFQLPGVSGVGLGAEGIIVHTDNPDILPKGVEGLPIIPAPPWGPGKFLPSRGAWN